MTKFNFESELFMKSIMLSFQVCLVTAKIDSKLIGEGKDIEIRKGNKKYNISIFEIQDDRT